MVQEPDAATRNLVVMSVLLIAYFYGGGTLLDNTLKFPLVNIEFDKTGFLRILMWIMYAWFVFRYWQSHAGDYFEALKNELNQLDRTEIDTCVDRRLGQKESDDPKFFSDGFLITGTFWPKIAVTMNYGQVNSRTDSGRVLSFKELTPPTNKKIPPNFFLSEDPRGFKM